MLENAPQIIEGIIEPWRQAFGDAPPLAILNNSLVPVLGECLDQKDTGAPEQLTPGATAGATDLLTPTTKKPWVPDGLHCEALFEKVALGGFPLQIWWRPCSLRGSVFGYRYQQLSKIERPLTMTLQSRSGA